MIDETTRCIWIRHAPSQRPDGHVPAYDPDICPDDNAAAGLCKSLPDGAHWLISPLKRCQQTAQQVEAILTQQNRPVAVQKTIVPEIIEQDLGRWAGMRIQDVRKELENGPSHNFSFQTADLVPPDGESFKMQYQRISAYLEQLSRDLMQSKDGRPHIFFAHAHTIRAVIAYCMKLDLDQALSIQIANYSQTIFDFKPLRNPSAKGSKWQLVGLNRLP